MKVDNDNPDEEVKGNPNKGKAQGVKVYVDGILMEALNVSSVVFDDLKEFKFLCRVKNLAQSLRGLTYNVPEKNIIVFSFKVIHNPWFRYWLVII